jgi:hypothetical protein
MVPVVDASPVQELTLKECRASSGRYWASSLIKRLSMTTGAQSLQAQNRKTRILRHAGGYKEFLMFAVLPYNVYGVINIASTWLLAAHQAEPYGL